MRKGRISRQQAETVWFSVCDALAQRPKLRGGLVLPQIDMDAVFKTRKSMTINAVVNEIARCVAMVNG
jgi:hypothetical protein